MNIQDLPLSEQTKAIFLKNGISALYPPQIEAIKAGALDGKNLVLASPTASGKTLVAELCAVKRVLEEGGKVLYLIPLRALASEKYEEFKKWEALTKPNGAHLRVGISTGDYDSSDLWLQKYDIIILTNEKADSLLRHKAPWMNDISLIIADEVHFLNDSERGPTLEVVLTRLMDINPQAQILALSATIRNADEIAEWLKASSVTTDWRPVKLIEGAYLNGGIEFNDGSSVVIKDGTNDPIINLTVHTINHGGQILVFAETRRKAVSLAEKIAPSVKKCLSKPELRTLKEISDKILSSGEKTRISELLAKLILVGTAYHHAGISASHRKIIEDAFKAGKIKVIVATPTLAAGVNLPARMVVINNYERYVSGLGMYPIQVLEYKQMAGRAGRPKYDEKGEAVLIARTADEQDFLMQSYVFAKPERIWSKLAIERVLRSHVLAAIASGYVRSEQGLFEFFGKAFYAHQYDLKNIEKLVSNILQFLYKEEIVIMEGSYLHPTEFGKRLSELYVDPVSGALIRDGLYNRAKKITDLSFLHLVCHTPDISPKFYPRRKEAEELDTYMRGHENEFLFDLPEEYDDMTAYEEFLAEIKCAKVAEGWIDEASEDQIIERYSVEPGDLFRFVENVKWLTYATHELAALFGHKDLLSHLSRLMERVKYGVKPELLPLVKLEGVGRIRGRMLHNAGLTSINVLQQASLSKLASVPLIGPQTARKIKEQVGGTVSKEEWDSLKGKSWKQNKLLPD